MPSIQPVVAVDSGEQRWYRTACAIVCNVTTKCIARVDVVRLGKQCIHYEFCSFSCHLGALLDLQCGVVFVAISVECSSTLWCTKTTLSSIPGSISASTRACHRSVVNTVRAKAGFDSPPGSVLFSSAFSRFLLLHYTSRKRTQTQASRILD